MPNKKHEAHHCLLPFYQANQFKKGSSFNLCFAYSLKNYSDMVFFVQKVQELVESQSYLRQTFSLKNNKLITCIHHKLAAHINHLNSTINEVPDLIKILCNQKHDLENESSVKLNIIKIIDNHNEYIILFNIHHILIDGYSLDEFIDSLNRLLQNKSIIQTDTNNYIAQLKEEQTLEIPDKSTDITRYIQSVEEIYENMELPLSNQSTSQPIVI